MIKVEANTSTLNRKTAHNGKTIHWRFPKVGKISSLTHNKSTVEKLKGIIETMEFYKINYTNNDDGITDRITYPNYISNNTFQDKIKYHQNITNLCNNLINTEKNKRKIKFN